MSLIINLYYTGENGSARHFVEEMEKSRIPKRIREEAGNERYEYFFSVNDPETTLLIVNWTDQAAIDKRHKSSMMAE